MYYDYSFCDDVSTYQNELDFLDQTIPNTDIVVHKATTMPFSFCLSKNRQVTALFTNLKCYYMFAAWETEKEKFLSCVNKYAPFDNDLIQFALHNTLDIDAWDQSILQFILSYSSKGLCCFDGPFNEFGPEVYRKHLAKLMKTRNKNITAEYQVEKQGNINIYEFPNKLIDFVPNSLIITNRHIQGCNLLFEDKLKIYGV